MSRLLCNQNRLMMHVMKNMVIMSSVVIVIVAAGCLFLGSPGALSRLSLENAAPNSTAAGSDDYIGRISGDGKSLDIIKDGIVLGHVAVQDLPGGFSRVSPPQQSGENPNISFSGNNEDPENNGNESGELLYDSKRDTVFIVAWDESSSGAQNASYAIYAYDLKTHKISLLFSIFSSEFDIFSLSPNQRYLVYHRGVHGGSCYDTHWLEVYDLDTGAVVATVKAQPTLGPGEADQDIAFGKWLTADSFSYSTETEYCRSTTTSTSTGIYVVK